MASLSNFVYPPIIEAAMDSFLRNEPCRIYFDINDFNSQDEISGIQVIAYQQDNSQYAIDKGISSSRIIGRGQSFNKDDSTIYDDTKQLFFIDLPYTLFTFKDQQGFPIDTYYKIQIRFVKAGFDWNNYYNTKINYNGFIGFTPQEIYENQQYWSEWSTGCLVKGIYQPIINTASTNITNSVNYYQQFVDLFAELQWYDPVSSSIIQDNYTYETLQSYEIKIFLEHDNSSILLVDSGLLYPSELDKSKLQIYYKIPYKFEVGSRYKITIDYTTSGNYQVKNHVLDIFQIIESDVDSELEYDLFRAIPDNEEGCIHLQLKGTFNGNLCIRRADSSTNFTVWEDIKYISLVTSEDQLNFHWNDYTVKSGVFYKYGIQRITTSGVRGKLYELGENDEVYDLLPNFEHIFLVAGGQQLKIKFNKQVQDFKHIVKESVSETLGSKYPYIRRNSNVDYRQFSISGLISYQADEKNLLVSKNDLNRQIGLVLTEYQMNDEFNDAFRMLATSTNLDTNYNQTTTLDSLATIKGISEDIPYDSNSIFGVYNTQYKNSTLQQVKSKIAASYQQYKEQKRISDLYDVTLERDFREEVMKFLYSNQAMLFKSGEEGNMIVKLTEVSFAPNQELQGRVYDFSATVSEIADYNLDNCFKYGIQSIGALTDGMKDWQLNFGSLKQVFTTNIVDVIRNNIEAVTTDTTHQYRTTIPSLNWVRLEFQSDPYWIQWNGDNNTTPIYSTEPNSGNLYGYIFEMKYDAAGGESGSAWIFVDANSRKFELLSDDLEEKAEKDIYEATIYNVYVDGISLYDKAKIQVSSDTSLSQEMIEDQAITLAEEYLNDLDFIEDFSITEINLPMNDEVLVDYFYRSFTSSYNSYIKSQTFDVIPDQISNIINSNTSLTDIITNKYNQKNYDTNKLLSSQQELTAIYNINIEAPENSVFLIQDAYDTDFTGNDDTSYRHLVGVTGSLTLNDINSEEQPIEFTNITYVGKHFYYAPAPQMLIEAWAAYFRGEDTELLGDIDLNADTTFTLMHQAPAAAEKMDTSFVYDCTSIDTAGYTKTTFINHPLFKTFCIFTFVEKGQYINYVNVDGTENGWYQAVWVDEENNESGVDVLMPAPILLNYIADTTYTVYNNE